MNVEPGIPPFGQGTPPPPFPEPGRRMVDPAATPADRSYAMWIHLGGLIAAVVAAVSAGIGFWAPPLVVLIMWQTRRQESAFIDDHGREAMNFQISLILLALIAFVLGLATCGIGWLFLVPAVYVLGVVGMILASVAASRGEYFRYPACIRLIS